MGLIVETGDGLASPRANSYITVDEADVYAVEHGSTAWTDATVSPTVEGKEAAIIRATAYIDATYRSKFPGDRLNGRAQGLEWPRGDATDIYDNDIPSDEVPIEMKAATAEAAIREIAAPGSLSPDYTAAQKVTSETVGPLSVSYSDRLTSSGLASSQPIVTVIDGILAPLIGQQRQLSFFGTAVRAN